MDKMLSKLSFGASFLFGYVSKKWTNEWAINNLNKNSFKIIEHFEFKYNDLNGEFVL